MGRPELSVCSLTLNSCSTLPLWVERAREYADEVVIAVDAASDDGTVEAARDCADRVFVVQHPRFSEEVLDWLLRQATGKWILRLDDDEVLSPVFATVRDTILGDGDVSHYYLQCRWAVPAAEGGYNWIRQFPWYPSPSLRLLRNVGSLFAHPQRLHTATSALGGGRLLRADEACFYHADLVWRSRAVRERKVRDIYNGLLQEYYLYEERVHEDCLEPVRDEAVTLWLNQTVTARSLPAAPTSPVTSGADPGVVTLTEIASVSQSHAPVEKVYRAAFVSHDTPSYLQPRQGYQVTVRVRNESDGVWLSAGPRGGARLSYHWLMGTGEVVVFNGWPMPFPKTVVPGETVDVVTGVWAPENPGHYVLAWDIAFDGTWLSESGCETARVAVQVGTPDETPVVTDPIPSPLPGYRRASRALIRRFPALHPYVVRIRDRALRGRVDRAE